MAEQNTITEDYITYRCRPDGTAVVAHCSGWYGNRIIPETVAGYRVTSIGANAFPEGSCRSLYIPDSVTEIKSLPVDFTEKVWDRPRFGMRENAMDIDREEYAKELEDNSYDQPGDGKSAQDMVNFDQGESADYSYGY